MITVMSHFTDKTGEPIYSVPDVFDNMEDALKYLNTTRSVAYMLGAEVITDQEFMIEYVKTNGASVMVNVLKES